MQEDEMLPPQEAAKILNVAHNTLRFWRHERRGPAFVRIGERLIRYRRVDLEAWVERHRCDPALRN